MPNGSEFSRARDFGAPKMNFENAPNEPKKQRTAVGWKRSYAILLDSSK